MEKFNLNLTTNQAFYLKKGIDKALTALTQLDKVDETIFVEFEELLKVNSELSTFLHDQFYQLEQATSKNKS